MLKNNNINTKNSYFSTNTLVLTTVFNCFSNSCSFVCPPAPGQMASLWIQWVAMDVFTAMIKTWTTW